MYTPTSHPASSVADTDSSSSSSSSSFLSHSVPHLHSYSRAPSSPTASKDQLSTPPSRLSRHYPHPYFHLHSESDLFSSPPPPPPTPSLTLDTPLSSFCFSFSAPSSATTMISSTPDQNHTDNHTQHHHHDAAHLCLSPLHSWSTPTFTTPGPSPSAMLLLSDPIVDRELRMIARRIVMKQRRADDGEANLLANGDDSNNGGTITGTVGPSLFVILPTLASYASSGPADQEFRLFFLCDSGEQEDGLLRLHICENGPAPMLDSTTDNDVDMDVDNVDNDFTCQQGQTDSHGGFRLRDLDEFLSDHTIPMLSLLRVLQDNPDASSSFTSDLGKLAGRIRAATRLLASRAHEALLDFQEHPTVDEKDFVEYESAIPNLQETDFWDATEVMPLWSSEVRNGSSDHGSENNSPSARVLGGRVLCPLSHASLGDGVLWLCRDHNEVFCQASAAERLQRFIKQHHGDCIPIERSCEIQFFERKDAREFYGMLAEYQCVMKLKIHLAWQNNTSDDGNDNSASDNLSSGVTEDDLWELCDAIHASNLRELTLDCGYGEAAAGYQCLQENVQDEGKTVRGPSFRPLLGILCRAGLVSLTIENFAGEISMGGASIVIQGDLKSFSIQQFRTSIEHDGALVVPEGISLRQLAFRHWASYPGIQGVTSVVVACPNLMELETQTISMESLFFSIQNAKVNLGKMAYVNFTESPFESVEVTIWRLEGDRPAVRKVQRRTARPPSLFLQSLLGLEHLTITKYVRLWEYPEQMHNVIHNNIGSLKSMDLACETEGLAGLWPFLTQELLEAEAIAAAAALAREDEEEGSGDHSSKNNKHVVRLRLSDLQGHCLESVSSQRDQTSLVIQSYDESFRPYLQSLSAVTTILSIDHGLSSTQQLELMLRHIGEDGLWFHELAWFLTPQTREDPAFMAALQVLVRRPEVQKFTVRIDGGGALVGGRSGQGASSLDRIETLLQSWNELTGMALGWMEYGRWMQELSAQLEHPFQETLCLPTGAGELTFASEDQVVIGAAYGSGGASSWSKGPVIYSLSCNCA